MPRLLSRIIALLLVPCLMADPATASGLAVSRSFRVPKAVVSQAPFTCQAVNPHPLWEEHPVPPVRPNPIACVVRQNAQTFLHDEPKTDVRGLMRRPSIANESDAAVVRRDSLTGSIFKLPAAARMHPAWDQPPHSNVPPQKGLVDQAVAAAVQSLAIEKWQTWRAAAHIAIAVLASPEPEEIHELATAIHLLSIAPPRPEWDALRILLYEYAKPSSDRNVLWRRMKDVFGATPFDRLLAQLGAVELHIHQADTHEFLQRLIAGHTGHISQRDYMLQFHYINLVDNLLRVSDQLPIPIIDGVPALKVGAVMFQTANRIVSRFGGYLGRSLAPSELSYEPLVTLSLIGIASLPADHQISPDHISGTRIPLHTFQQLATTELMVQLVPILPSPGTAHRAPEPLSLERLKRAVRFVLALAWFFFFMRPHQTLNKFADPITERWISPPVEELVTPFVSAETFVHWHGHLQLLESKQRRLEKMRQIKTASAEVFRASLEYSFMAYLFMLFWSAAGLPHTLIAPYLPGFLASLLSAPFVMSYLRRVGIHQDYNLQEQTRAHDPVNYPGYIPAPLELSSDSQGLVDRAIVTATMNFQKSKWETWRVATHIAIAILASPEPEEIRHIGMAIHLLRIAEQSHEWTELLKTLQAYSKKGADRSMLWQRMKTVFGTTPSERLLAQLGAVEKTMSQTDTHSVLAKLIASHSGNFSAQVKLLLTHYKRLVVELLQVSDQLPIQFVEGIPQLRSGAVMYRPETGIVSRFGSYRGSADARHSLGGEPLIYLTHIGIASLPQSLQSAPDYTLDTRIPLPLFQQQAQLGQIVQLFPKTIPSGGGRAGPNGSKEDIQGLMHRPKMGSHSIQDEVQRDLTETTFRRRAAYRMHPDWKHLSSAA